MTPTSATPDIGQPSRKEVARWRRYLANERAEERVYRNLAEGKTGEEREILLSLADAEQRHIAHWERLLGPATGREVGADLPTRLLSWLAGSFGSVFVLALMQRAETRSPYDGEQAATDAMRADEKIHAEVVRGLAERGRRKMSGGFRAAVFGANDGLVSNLALVLGVFGAGMSNSAVLLTGLSGLLAGALSMGAGEYVSVKSQRELLQASQPDPAAREVMPALDVDANELELVYRARGMDPEEAHAKALKVLVGTHIGYRDTDDQIAPSDHADDEEGLLGSGVQAAVSSFIFFASGAVIPILPFLLGLSGVTALIVAIVAVSLALVVTGGLVGILSGANPAPRALRQWLIGMGAAGITWAIGSAVGASPLG